MQTQQIGLVARVGRAFGAPISRRVVRGLCVVWLAGMLLPLVALCFYAHPVFDDFMSTLNTAQTWAKTGDLWQTFMAAWDDMVTVYQTWQGTWVAMLLSAFQPMVFSPRLFFLAPLGTLLALCLSAAYFIKALARRALGADGVATLALYTAFLTYLLQFFPSVREAIYWQSAAQYSWSVAALLWMLGLLLKLRAPQPKALYAWRCFALLVCGVVLGGCPYPLALGGAVGAALITAWCLKSRSRASAGSLFALAGIVASLVVVLLAPGNGVRQARVGEPMSALAAIATSVLKCLQQTALWAAPQLLALVIVAVALLWKPLQGCDRRFEHPVWFTVLSFGVLAASFVPPIYATGAESYLIGRILSSLFMLFSVLALLNVVYWTGYAAKRLKTEKAPFHTPAWVAALCLVLFVWGLFGAGITQTPSLSAAKDVLLGGARVYDAEMTEREQNIAAAKTDEEAMAQVRELSSAPICLPADLLPLQIPDPLTTEIHLYFRMAQLVDEYGAGRIPQAEWDAMAFAAP